MNDPIQTTLNAIEIGEQTCLGVFGKPTASAPMRSGNCFSIACEDGSWFRIVNFYVENLNFLLNTKVLSWPVKIKALSDKKAVICDERVPAGWCREEYCRVCCPDDLMPPQQRAKVIRQREEASGKPSGMLCLPDPDAPGAIRGFSIKFDVTFDNY